MSAHERPISAHERSGALMSAHERSQMTQYFAGKCIKDAELAEGAMAAVGLTWEEAAALCPAGVLPACHNAEVSVKCHGAGVVTVLSWYYRDVFMGLSYNCHQLML